MRHYYYFYTLKDLDSAHAGIPGVAGDNHRFDSQFHSAFLRNAQYLFGIVLTGLVKVNNRPVYFSTPCRTLDR
jgi:hypothetical protein